ncbi:MAG: hypothetical protein JSS88_00360 [Actinobacteria bacterium]|nr:hypothetical protein [Actinomycetota bacterium]
MGTPPADPPVGIPSDTDTDDGVAIRVARSGGIAGMTRRWSVQPAGDAEHWMLLVDRCPWDEKPPPGTGADRFVWRIEARIRRERHEQVIPEEHLSGPWRDLVEAVRAADGGTAPQ